MKFHIIFVFNIIFALAISNISYALTPEQKKAISQAEVLEKKKSYAEAIAILKKANQPQSFEILDVLAGLFSKTKDHLEEVRALELIKSTNPLSPAQYVRLGQAYAKIKKNDEAVKNFREALKVAPKFERAYEALYEFHLSANMMADARNIVIEIVDKFGSNKKWLNEFCRLELDQKYFDTAKDICQEAIINDPKHAANHVYLGLAHKGTGNDEQSRKILYSAAKQFPRSDLAQFEAGKLSFEAQNWELSQKHFSQCVKSNKKFYKCYFELAKAEYELKSYEKALANFIKACPHVKDVDVEIRRNSFELSKLKNAKVAEKYSKEVDSCKSRWYSSIKKSSQ